jgi:flagellar FliJ protein
MPFRFSLQAVLRFRESFERRERQRLEMITREMVQARQELEHAKKDRVAARAQAQKKLRDGVTSAEMQFELLADRARQRRIAHLQDHLSKLEDLRRRQLALFHKARQQREIMENLRDRQLEVYKVEEARREQQQMDDRFLMTHGRQEAS